MAEVDILTKVKIGLFGSEAGNHRDEILKLYIAEVTDFMKEAGVSATKLKSDSAVGCIIIGVNDLWNYSGGGVRLSEYFKMRVAQLAAGGDS